jgi:hypothetical protein
MSLHGIAKPVWRAFELLHTHAGSHTINTTATTHSNLSTLIAATTTFNLTTTDAVGAGAGAGALEAGSGRLFLSHWDASGAAVNHSKVVVSITIHCPPPSAASTTTNGSGASVCPKPGVDGKSQLYMIDERIAANLAWGAMGSPAVPTAAQLVQLKKHSELIPTPLVWKVSPSSGGDVGVRAEEAAGSVVVAEVVMPPNSACVITLL